MSKSSVKKKTTKKQSEGQRSWADLPGYAEFMAPFPWQMAQWQAMQNRAAQLRLPQAWLLVGPQGIGKRLLAAWWMQWLQCDSVRTALKRPQSADALPAAPCGVCANCAQVRAQTHSDCLWVCPEQVGSQIKIDQIREVIQFMQQTAKQGGHRVVVIEPVEAMNEAAQNALLKTLEEPGAGAQFLLVSHQPQRILPTISSRCQRLNFGVPETSEVLAWLKSLPLGALPDGVGPEQAVASLSAVSGAPLDLLAFLHSDWFSARQALGEALSGLALDPKQFAQVSQSWHEWPLADRIALIVQMFQERIRDKLLSATGADRQAPRARADVVADSEAMLPAFDVYRQLLGLYQLARSSSSGINEVLMWEKALMLWQSA